MKERGILVVIAMLAGAASHSASAEVPLGTRLSESLSSVLPEALGAALPGGIGGVAGITAVALLLGAQLIRRRK